MKNIKFIWEHLKGFRLLYIGAILCIAAGTLFNAINPLIVRLSIDSIIGGKAVDLPSGIKGTVSGLIENRGMVSSLILAALSLIIITGFRGIFLYLKGKWSAIAAESIARNLRNQIYDHLQHLPYEYHVRAKTGDLIQRCTSDIEQIRMFLAVQLVEIGRAIFILAITTTVMFNLHVKLALVALAVVPFIIAYSYFFYKEVKKTFFEADESEGRMSTTLQENLTGVRVVRAFAREAYEVEKFDQKNQEFREKQYRVLRFLAWFWSVSDFLSLFQIAAVLILGVYWSVMGEISLGTLVVFMSYEGMLLWPVRQLGRILTDMGKMQVAIERIHVILDEPIEFDEEESLKPAIEGSIKFKNVSFAYDDNQYILKNINFEVKKGQTVAILGPTGSGKSSLVHLLARLYDCQSGTIEIDGHDIRDIDKKWLRKHVGLVLQEPFLFARTIKENISFASIEADDTEIFEAANNASIHDVIQQFDKGYETMVGERGVSLSGGQKQRVAIARTIIRDCPILIFDDSLSAVDTETDARIRTALSERSKDITTFIISHRINTLSSADIILVLEDGEITQRGTHQELLHEDGMYRRVWKMQNEFLSDEKAI